MFLLQLLSGLMGQQNINRFNLLLINTPVDGFGSINMLTLLKTESLIVWTK